MTSFFARSLFFFFVGEPFFVQEGQLPVSLADNADRTLADRGLSPIDAPPELVAGKVPEEATFRELPRTLQEGKKAYSVENPAGRRGNSRGREQSRIDVDLVYRSGGGAARGDRSSPTKQ